MCPPTFVIFHFCFNYNHGSRYEDIQTLCDFLIGLSVSLLLCCRSSLYILDSKLSKIELCPFDPIIVLSAFLYFLPQKGIPGSPCISPDLASAIFPGSPGAFREGWYLETKI